MDKWDSSTTAFTSIPINKSYLICLHAVTVPRACEKALPCQAVNSVFLCGFGICFVSRAQGVCIIYLEIIPKKSGVWTFPFFSSLRGLQTELVAGGHSGIVSFTPTQWGNMLWVKIKLNLTLQVNKHGSKGTINSTKSVFQPTQRSQDK